MIQRPWRLRLRGKEQATLVEIWPLDESMSAHLILSGGREKLAVAETSNRTWQFFPRQVADEEKEKVVAAQPVEFDLSFSPLMSLHYFYFFWMFEFGWRTKTISWSEVWRSRCGFGIANFLSGLPCRILTIMYMYISFNSPILWVLYYQRESVRNVKAQLADPTVS